MAGPAGTTLVRDAWLLGNDVLEVGERAGGDGGTVRLHPYLDLLVEEGGHDPALLRASAAACRERASTLTAAGANPRSRRVEGYERAAAMLDAAAAVVPAGSPPPEWRRAVGQFRGLLALRRLAPSWWRRRGTASSVSVVYHVAPSARDISAVQAVIDGRPAATLRFHVCLRCRVAAVEDLDVDPDLRGVGVGARLLAAALRTAPPRDSYQWHAIAQPEPTRTFWRVVTRRFGFVASHVDRVPCAHMTSSGQDDDPDDRVPSTS